MPIYEIDYTPFYYVVNNTVDNIEDISTKINATEFLTCSVSCVIANANFSYITTIPQNITVVSISEATSKLLLITNTPIEDFEAISVEFGVLADFNENNWIILQPVYLNN